MRYSLQLFDGPKLLSSGQVVTLNPNRTALLFAYLAYQATWVPRDELLSLFWPDMREAKARQNLRALLYKSSKETYAQNFEVEEHQVRYLVQTDVDAFQDALSNADWPAAFSLYKGQFLAHYKGNESIEFEDWLEQTRHELQSLWRNAALNVAEQALQKNNYQQAIHLSEAILKNDFLAEDAVQLLMKAQTLAGNKTAALRIFESFRQELNKELDMQPIPEILELAEAIRTGQLSPATSKQEAAISTSQVKLNTERLPQPLTPFIGRTLEILELSQLLAEPNTRFITLLGPGGMGKSRLALQLLREQEAKFEAGVAFVALAPLGSADDIAIALAENLTMQLVGELSVEEEVIEFLKTKQMLIVLDNFEHLLAGASFAANLLAQTSQVKIICTSRTVLNIANEYIYDLAGLSIPSTKTAQLEAYDAVEFFLRSARRGRSAFRVEKQDEVHLLHLCQMLQGMPLALELAATWLRMFSLSELVTELERDFDLLESSGSMLNERHKSMRVVFDQSWRLLSEGEQEVLARLAVFQGGFTKEAAVSVASASPRILLSLINKSLLRTTPSGRFSMLEVLKQYAAEKLKDKTIAKNHATYFLELVNREGQQFRTGNPKAHLMVIEINLENIKKAWRYALKIEAFELISKAEKHLSFYFDLRARLQEGVALFQEAISVLANKESHKAILAKVLVSKAILYRWIGQLELSGELCEEALTLIEAKDDYATYINALDSLSYAYEYKGQVNEGHELIKQAYDLALESKNTKLIMNTRRLLAMTEHMMANYEKAEELYQTTLNDFRQSNDAIGIVEILSNYGEMLLELQAVARAKLMFHEALELAIKNGDTGFIPVTKAQLAYCLYKEADYLTAKQYYEEAIEIVNQNGSKRYEVQFLAELSLVELALTHTDSAYQLILKATIPAKELASFANLMDVYFAWASYLEQVGKTEAALQVYSLLDKHEASSLSYKQKAQNALNKSKNPIDFQLQDQSFTTYLAFLELGLESLK